MDLKDLLAQCMKRIEAAPVFVRPHLVPLASLLVELVNRIERLERDR